MEENIDTIKNIMQKDTIENIMVTNITENIMVENIDIIKDIM